MFCFWCGRLQRKVVSLREQLLRTPADRNGKPEFRSDTLLPVWLWAALDTRHILLNIQYILFPVRQLYFIKHHLQMRGSGRGLLCRNLTGWTMCEKRRLCTLIATVKHRTNILNNNIQYGLTLCYSSVVFPFSEQTLFLHQAAIMPLAVNAWRCVSK